MGMMEFKMRNIMLYRIVYIPMQKAAWFQAGPITMKYWSSDFNYLRPLIKYCTQKSMKISNDN